MKRCLFLLLIACSTSLFSKTTPAPTLAVYNVDSVLIVMPEYFVALREYLKFDSLIKEEDSLIQNELVQRISQFTIDSTKYSPLIRELKKKEIQDLKERVRDFQEMASDDLENKKVELLAPLKKKIADQAAAIGKEKLCTSVICTGGYIKKIYFSGNWDSFPPQNRFGTQDEFCLLNFEINQPLIYLDPKIKTVNITELLISKLKI